MFVLRLVTALLIVASAGASACAAPAPLPFDRIQRALKAVHVFNDVAVAPDGGHFAYTDGAVHVGDVATPRKTHVLAACTSCTGSSVAWSPDSLRLAFVTTDAAGQGNVAVADLAGGTVRIVTHAHGPVSTPRWSPDGSRLAFLYSPGSPRTPSALQPGTPDAGVVGSSFYEQRLAVVPVAGGAIRLLGPGDLNVYEYDWSPDGTRFAASAAHGNGDANWWVAALYTIDLASGTATRIHRPKTQMASPRFSGDGTRIAYICGIMSDEAVTGGDICVVPARGGDAVDVTPDFDASVTTIDWRGSHKTIFATDNRLGKTCVTTFDVDTSAHHDRWCGLETIYANNYANLVAGDTGVSLSTDGNVSAVIRQSFASPPEVALGPVGAWQRVTSANANTVRLSGTAHSITWTSDGATVQGFLIEPLGYRRGTSAPLITIVHGGPSYATAPLYPAGADSFGGVLTARGYAVFEPNPRGSYGGGEAFTRANVKDFGGGDLRDILAGLDAATAVIPASPKRLGIMGWSYGGYMTMWALTQTNRFKAAVSGAGLSDWLSYYGTNGIDTWMLPFFGASVYDDPAVYEKSSPIAFIKNVHTPTLMLGGTLDDEVPITQSYEYWHALKDLHVPAQLVVYPGEGHLFGKPADQLDVSRRLVGWFDRWLK
jgi:dipeptidyl aminopeptidase/acylaminoacyl peptidase